MLYVVAECVSFPTAPKWLMGMFFSSFQPPKPESYLGLKGSLLYTECPHYKTRLNKRQKNLTSFWAALPFTEAWSRSIRTLEEQTQEHDKGLRLCEDCTGVTWPTLQKITLKAFLNEVYTPSPTKSFLSLLRFVVRRLLDPQTIL